MLKVDEGGNWAVRPRVSAALVLLGGVLLILLAWLLRRPLALLVISVAVAAAVGPVAGWLDRTIPRGLAVAMPYIIVLLLLGLSLWWMVRHA